VTPVELFFRINQNKEMPAEIGRQAQGLIGARGNVEPPLINRNTVRLRSVDRQKTLSLA
jgi:hypothetical protein